MTDDTIDLGYSLKRLKDYDPNQGFKVGRIDLFSANHLRQMNSDLINHTFHELGKAIQSGIPLWANKALVIELVGYAWVDLPLVEVVKAHLIDPAYVVVRLLDRMWYHSEPDPLVYGHDYDLDLKAFTIRRTLPLPGHGIPDGGKVEVRYTPPHSLGDRWVEL